MNAWLWKSIASSMNHGVNAIVTVRLLHVEQLWKVAICREWGHDWLEPQGALRLQGGAWLIIVIILVVCVLHHPDGIYYVTLTKACGRW